MSAPNWLHRAWARVALYLISKPAFATRKSLCSSCSGRGTGLACSACCREVADERDRLLVRLEKLEEQAELPVLGWYILIDREGLVGPYETREVAEAANLELHPDPDCTDYREDETQVVEVGIISNQMREVRETPPSAPASGCRR